MSINKPLLSLLIPCYNVANYLERLMASITSQKEFLDKKVMLIFLDDGSTDNTFKILVKYQNKYKSNINLLQQKNSGLVSARKKLVEACTTEYFVHVDSDDYLCKNALHCYFEAISKKNDLSFFRAYYEKNGKISTFFNNKFCNSKYSIKQYVNNNFVFAWNIVIKKSFYLSTKISHLDIQDVGEDCFTVYWLLSHTNLKKISFAPTKTYVYVYKPNSYCNDKKLTSKRASDYANNFLLFLTKSTTTMKRKEFYDTILSNYAYMATSVVLYNWKKHKNTISDETNFKDELLKKILNALVIHKVKISSPKIFWKKVVMFYLKVDKYLKPFKCSL